MKHRKMQTKEGMTPCASVRRPANHSALSPSVHQAWMDFLIRGDAFDLLQSLVDEVLSGNETLVCFATDGAAMWLLGLFLALRLPEVLQLALFLKINLLPVSTAIYASAVLLRLFEGEFQ